MFEIKGICLKFKQMLTLSISLWLVSAPFFPRDRIGCENLTNPMLKKHHLTLTSDYSDTMPRNHRSR